MPWKLIAPGKRKGNPYWIARGTHPVSGRSLEVSTRTRDKAAAKQFAKDFWTALCASRAPRPGEEITFAQAAQLYAAYRGFELGSHGRDADARRIRKLIAVLGNRSAAEIGRNAL